LLCLYRLHGRDTSVLLHLYRLGWRYTHVLLHLCVGREQVLHLVNGQPQAVQEGQGGTTGSNG
jgi:hypothetical protein